MPFSPLLWYKHTRATGDTHKDSNSAFRSILIDPASGLRPDWPCVAKTVTLTVHKVQWTVKVDPHWGCVGGSTRVWGTLLKFRHRVRTTVLSNAQSNQAKGNSSLSRLVILLNFYKDSHCVVCVNVWLILISIVREMTRVIFSRPYNKHILGHQQNQRRR